MSCVSLNVDFVGRNVLGGNFSLVGVPSVGASGAIFSSVAVGFLFYLVIKVLTFLER